MTDKVKSTEYNVLQYGQNEKESYSTDVYCDICECDPCDCEDLYGSSSR